MMFKRQTRPGWTLLVVGGLAAGMSALCACGGDAPPPVGGKPSWAKTSTLQDDDATKRTIPVARELDLGGGEKLRFVWIPPGTFTRGSRLTEERRASNEKQHSVEMRKGYYLSIHEVTNGQYRQFKSDHDSGEFKGASLNGPTQPVTNVSHDDAVSFVEWLNGRGGSDRYRLPTDAEWEYACRAGTTTPFHVGGTISTSQANYDGGYTYGGGSTGEYRQRSTPVGSFAPNPWGLYDMHGNVWEWCADWDGPYPTRPVRDPRGALRGSARVMRGGSWYSTPCEVRSATRDASPPEMLVNDLGFRVVAYLAPDVSAPSARPAVAATPEGQRPPWAKISRFQEDDAAERRLPVAQEVDLGDGEKLRFVWIPPGTFTMGRPDTDREQVEWDVAREVELTKGYYLSIHEVTNGQYRQFRSEHDSGERFDDARQPVQEVSYDDAELFVAWLNDLGRRNRYRLPTEAEWEYACRAETTTPFHFGTTISPWQANYDGRFTYAGGWEGENRDQTTRVGTFAPNAWGLYDMHGNVSEWCADEFVSYATEREFGPQGVSNTEYRLRALRGGSFGDPPDQLRSAHRTVSRSEAAAWGVGFRVVLVATPDPAAGADSP